MDASLGFFSGFNARHLDAEQIAKAFVPGPKFAKLLGLQHSLLVGARGSGKTHMLKMLQPKALNSWCHPDAAWIREKINYWAIFVPADEAWSQQIDFVAASLPKEFQSKFRSVVFCTHVQRAIVDCFLQLTHDRPTGDLEFAKVELDNDEESDLCKTVARSWKLRPQIHSFIGLRQALVDRSADLYELVDHPSRAEALLAECQSQAVQAALRALNAFDSKIGRFDGRWCLMFDEIEIAPPEVQSILFRSLRSTDQKLLFKIALSPSTQAAEVFTQAMGPSAGNDFDEISLYSDQRESAAFCESLWKNLAIGTEVENIEPSLILGHSTFHPADVGNPYAPRGRWQEASSRLARKDPSYVSLLERYGINPNALDGASHELKNAVVRKIGPIVGFRDFMLKPRVATDVKVSFRQDKARPALLYSGWEALCLISEGNPRWFTGIARSLLIEKLVGKNILPKPVQYAAISGASRKFLDYIATIPSSARAPNSGAEGGLRNLVGKLVKAFRNSVLLEDFSLEPVLSFVVDENLPENLRQAIFDGLYSGAFVPVGDVERKFRFTGDINLQHLRVTYLIAPLEMLPLRSGKPRNLSGLIGEPESELANFSSRRTRRTKLRMMPGPGEHQTKLFNE